MGYIHFTLEPSVHISAWPRLTTLLLKVMRLGDMNRSVKRPILSTVSFRTSRSIMLNTSERGESKWGTMRMWGGGELLSEGSVVAVRLAWLSTGGDARKLSSAVSIGREFDGDDKAAVNIIKRWVRPNSHGVQRKEERAKRERRERKKKDRRGEGSGPPQQTHPPHHFSAPFFFFFYNAHTHTKLSFPLTFCLLFYAHKFLLDDF